MSLRLGIKDFLDDVARIATMMQARFNHPVFLTTPLTSASWDGDARSTTAKTLIDLSAVFGVPAGAKAVIARIAARDSGSAAADCWLILSPEDTSGEGIYIRPGGRANDRYEDQCVIVPCNSDGDIYFQILASGALTFDVWLKIWGYWL